MVKKIRKEGGIRQDTTLCHFIETNFLLNKN